ncbi:MAG: PAS domain S-box protein [Dehalococcoidales bacterium]|nr:PAS domain S-box protein [Dehalococcoidales bacterium]
MAERDYLKTAKELEKERRKLLRNVMATIPDSLLILDRTLLIKTANRSFYRLFQVKPKEVIGRGITDMLDDEDGKLSTKLAALLGTKDRVENYELRYQSAKLGERIYNITARGIIVAEEEEEEEEELVVIRDITERKRGEEMLLKSEENFRRSLDDSPLGIRIVNSDGETTYANRAMLDIYGHASIEELKATPVKERYTPESYAQHQMRKEKRQRGEYVPSNYEISIVRKGGEIRYLEVFRKEVLWNGHTQFQVIYQDITERKRTEEALRKSEEKYRSLVDNVRLGIFRSTPGPSGRFLEVSKAMEEITGYSRKELLRMDVSSLYVHPEEREPVTEEIASAREKMTKELNFRKKDGTEIVVADTKTPVRNSAGEILYFDGVLEDVTEHKQAEEMLRQSEEKLRLMFESVAEGIAIVDLKGVIIEVNQKMLDMHRLSTKDKLVGKPVLEFVVPRDHKKVQLSMQKTLEEGRIEKLEVSALRSDGSKFFVEVSAGVLRDSSGHPVGSVATLRDITERKHAEEEKLELERKAHNASRLVVVGEMAAGIAHEINNPLTPILGFTELLMRRELPEDIKTDLKIIYDSTRRTADVTRRLLTFARQSKPMRTLCSINEVVESALQLRAYHLKTNNIKVITELDPGLPSTVADAGQLQQALLNLIMNAEYEMTQSHGGGNLLIKTEKTGNIIRVSVKDDGPGISRENMERLFTPFFTTKKVGEGTGLGLSVCHGIIAEHDGRIYAESEVGRGATFIVEILIVKQQKEKGVEPSESDKGEAVVEAAKARILVVDDEPTIVQVLKQVLTDEGYQVKATGKAKEALRLIEGEKFACILLDIRLLDMSGIRLYQHLDNTDKSYAQRIIFITGDVMGPDTMEFFSRVRASYITKPFDIEQLKREVKNKLTLGA